MARIATMLLVLGLLGGTAAAFAVTEGLKLEKSPILETRVDKLFSPVCRCPKRVAHIAFRLRRSDRLRLEIVRGSRVVRTLIRGRRFHRGRVHFTWNGRDDAGRLVAQGVYKPRVHLAAQHRTIVLPNPIVIDTSPPRVRVLAVAPREVARSGRVVVRYRFSEHAHAILLVDGRRVVFTRWQLPAGTVDWRPGEGGVYRLQLTAQDAAGNLSRASRPFAVRVRFIALARHEIHAKAGTRFGVNVSTDARGFTWRLGLYEGTARPGLLVLRAPGRAGRLLLVVEEHGVADRAVVIVRPRG